jgi:hypothetical protein
MLNRCSALSFPRLPRFVMSPHRTVYLNAPFAIDRSACNTPRADAQGIAKDHSGPEKGGSSGDHAKNQRRRRTRFHTIRGHIIDPPTTLSKRQINLPERKLRYAGHKDRKALMRRSLAKQARHRSAHHPVPRVTQGLKPSPAMDELGIDDHALEYDPRAETSEAVVARNFTEPVAATAPEIDSLYDDVHCEIHRSIVEWRRLLSTHGSVGPGAGRTGDLEPFATSLKEQRVEPMEAEYQRCRSPGVNPEGASPQSLRHELRSQRRAYNEQLSSGMQIKYHPTSSELVKLGVRKIEIGARKSTSLAFLRRKIRERRGIAMSEMSRLLAATLLSSQDQGSKRWRHLDSLASLPEEEKPSTTTLVGKTIAALGFYDKLDGPNNNIATKSGQQSGEPVVRWVYPQLRPRFQSTQPMRAHHPTLMSFNTDVWDHSVDVLKDGDTNGRTRLGGEYSTSSLSDGTSVGQTDTPHPSSERHPQRPDDQYDRQSPQPPDEQSPQLPDESMDNVAADEPPDESDHEEDSESEISEDSETEEPEEEHTPLSYQIPSDVLHNALQAPPQTRASYWSQKLYRGPEDEELLLHYCVNMEVSERVAKHFLNEKVVGFDIEWKPWGAAVNSIKENASLIQLANEDRIALFHIARFPGKTPEQLMPPSLKAVLESADISKVGVAVKGDCSRLEKYFGLNIRGVFELSRLYNLVEYSGSEPNKVNNRLVKLATQVHQHLLLPLHKGEPFVDDEQKISSVRESDWSRPLDHEQIHYAAADAYAGFRLFDVMESKRKKLKPTPPAPRLCDYDNKPAPRTTAKAKRAKKATPEMKKVVAESLSGREAEDADEEAYETAAEELVEEAEDEDQDSEFTSDSSENENPDADYVPKVRGRVALGQRSTGASAIPDVPAHRIGRLGFSKLTGADPAYPTLPTLSTQEDASSDESEAFDPPPKAPRQRRVPQAAQEAEVLPANVEASDDEFPDPELEEAFATMDLGDPRNAASDPVADTSIEAEVPDLTTPSFTPLIQSDTTNYTPEYTLATTWAQTYLASTIPPPASTASSRIRATVPPLRAYHMWHRQRVPLGAIGAHLRDPPLAQSTVSSYIIQAINLEKLEYRDADLIVLMGALPANLRLGRYGWLSRKLGIVR